MNGISRLSGTYKSRQTENGQEPNGKAVREETLPEPQGKAAEYRASGNSVIEQLREQADSIKKAFDPKKKTNLYDATMDLMLVEQTEEIPGLRAIHAKLLFRIRSVRASRAKPGAIRAAISKLTKVIGKVKAKIKNLQKEEQLEEKRRRAEEERRRAKEEAAQRELELRKKIRKAKERSDIEESKMGLGANYGGPSEDFSPETAAAYSGTGEMLPDLGTGAGTVVDMAVADVGAGGAAALDICV